MPEMTFTSVKPTELPHADEQHGNPAV